MSVKNYRTKKNIPGTPELKEKFGQKNARGQVSIPAGTVIPSNMLDPHTVGRHPDVFEPVKQKKS